MPGLDGWGVARAVRRASPGVGVVLMSAGFDPRDHRAGQPDGVVTLPKPFALEDLIDVIDRIVAPDQDRRAAAPCPPRAHRER
jgi:CheY-like chemotaxis protein